MPIYFYSMSDIEMVLDLNFVLVIWLKPSLENNHLVYWNFKGPQLGKNPTLGGWWGDLDDKIWAVIYEAFPGKLNDATARSLKKLVEESLEWMVNDGVVKSISCSALLKEKLLLSMF